MKIPKKDKSQRIQDIKKVLLPELMPDQMHLLGVEQSIKDSYQKTLTQAAPGMELVKRLNFNANKIQEEGIELYKERKSDSHPTQLQLVINNCDIFMQQAAQLMEQLEPESNEHLLKLVDRLIETALHVGYFAGSNDSFAITDRYVNAGYETKVTKPQNAGLKKSESTNPLKELIQIMTNYIYSNPEIGGNSKPSIAEAIQILISDFSQQGNNKELPALIRFSERVPTVGSIQSWLKTINRPAESKQYKKTSTLRVVEVLKKEFNHQTIKKAITLNT